MSTLAADSPGPAVVPTPATSRMAIAVLALVGLLVSAYMAAYAYGLLGQIACGVGGGCEVVQHSPWARFLGVPVSLIGMFGYAALLAAALYGLQPEGAGSPAVARVLAAGATLGLLFSGYLTALEAFVIHAWCRWCVASAIIAVGIFLFSLPEFGRLRSST